MPIEVLAHNLNNLAEMSICQNMGVDEAEF
jgi:hypothetical protein